MSVPAPPIMPAGSPPTPAAPWVPDEVEPIGGWPPAPHAVPLIVCEWERPDHVHHWEAYPPPLTTPRWGVTIKDDHSCTAERVRRFVEAWRWLRRAKARLGDGPAPGPTNGCRAPAAAVLGREECDRFLAGAGVLVRTRPPARRR